MLGDINYKDIEMVQASLIIALSQVAYIKAITLTKKLRFLLLKKLSYY